MEDNKTYMCETCDGGRMCCSPRHRPYSILRWILGAVIIFIAFGLGMKIGRLEGEIEGGYPRHVRMFSSMMAPAGGEFGDVYYAPATTRAATPGVKTN